MMIYTVKPIKKMMLIYNSGNDFAIEVALHPNQRWMIQEYADNSYVSKDSITIKMCTDEVFKYFREVEE